MTGWLGTLSVDSLGLPLFTLALGLLDGFNPCAMWVLLFLLSMLIHLKDFIAPGRGLSLSIPEPAKPGLYARVRTVLNARSLWLSLISVAVLAVVVNFIEALCTAGIPAIYTAVLTQQELSPALHYSSLGLYIAGYMADDALMVAAAVFALNSPKLSDKSGRLLKLLSGLIMLALGLVMLFKPELLL